MDKPTQLTPQISPDSKSLVVTVIEDIPPVTCANGSPIKHFILTNDEGNEVIGHVYRRNVRVFCPIYADPRHQYMYSKDAFQKYAPHPTPLSDAPFCT